MAQRLPESHRICRIDLVGSFCMVFSIVNNGDFVVDKVFYIVDNCDLTG